LRRLHQEADVKFVSRKPTVREAKANAHRRVIKFAWRPINCDDGHTYWFRRIVIEQEAYMRDNRDMYGRKTYTKSPAWRVHSKMPLHKLPRAEVRLLKGQSE
jgi:hypothetical protein